MYQQGGLGSVDLFCNTKRKKTEKQRIVENLTKIFRT